ncbi:RNA polymerase sporulation-specific sigma factor [Halanaerobacter jeridensis]|uniref:RNA polymerase sigma factor n=1 Tax=Halanaerobacter jeridensis TaxID=706427 RepID=A0A938XVE7_9FIRM|nr:RNA polymerase sporulation-specific sigma factor [Halanaerobacter jeridensis]
MILIENNGKEVLVMNRVELSGLNTNDLNVLSHQEMKKLFHEMKQGSIEARTKLIQGNLKLVLSVLKKFRNRDYAADDLFQVGCIGLIKAIDNFDTNVGVRFSTYAVPMIVGEIKRYLRDDQDIKVSRSLRKIAYEALQMKKEWQKRKYSEPSLKEIAEKLDITKERLVYALDATKTPVSLFKSVFKEEGDSLFLLEQLSGSDSTEELINSLSLEEALEKLNSREEIIIRMRFYEGLTQSEIADKIGISQAQVSRLQSKILNKLNDFIQVKRERRIKNEKN